MSNSKLFIKIMKPIRAAIVGYGNIGKYTLQALECAPDFEVVGIVRRNPAQPQPEELNAYKVVSDIAELEMLTWQYSLLQREKLKKQRLKS